MSAPKPKIFYVNLTGDYSLTIEDIWPDGDAPENPTAEDVIKAMKETSGSSVSRLMGDWGFEVEVTVDGKKFP
jgi:hypothetical protein